MRRTKKIWFCFMCVTKRRNKQKKKGLNEISTNTENMQEGEKRKTNCAGERRSEMRERETTV